MLCGLRSGIAVARCEIIRARRLPYRANSAERLANQQQYKNAGPDFHAVDDSRLQT